MAKGGLSLTIDGIRRRTHAVAVRNLHDALTLLRDEIKKDIGRQGSRKVRSKPGEPPRKQSGRLRRGIKYSVDEDTLTGRLYSEAPYSKFLEEGTPRMRERPFIGPAYRRLHPRLITILQRRK